MPTSMTICQSRNHELSAILKYLKDDLERSREEMGGSFFYNKDIISKCHEDKQLFIIRDQSSAVIYGYLAGDMQRGEIDILEIRHAHRRRGFGKLLVEDFAKRTADAGHFGLRVLCKPKSSIPFWEHIGFSSLLGSIPEDDEESHVYRYRPFPCTFAPIGKNKLFPTKITFEQEMELRKCDIKSFTTNAVYKDRTFFLVDPYSCATRSELSLVEIVVNNEIVYDGPVSCEQARRLPIEVQGPFIRICALASESRL